MYSTGCRTNLVLCKKSPESVLGLGSSDPDPPTKHSFWGLCAQTWSELEYG